MQRGMVFCRGRRTFAGQPAVAHSRALQTAYGAFSLHCRQRHASYLPHSQVSSPVLARMPSDVMHKRVDGSTDAASGNPIPGTHRDACAEQS